MKLVVKRVTLLLCAVTLFVLVLVRFSGTYESPTTGFIRPIAPVTQPTKAANPPNVQSVKEDRSSETGQGISDLELEAAIFGNPSQVAQLLNSLDTAAASTLLSRIGVALRREIKFSGDYEKILPLLETLQGGHSRELMKSWIIGFPSGRNPLDDYLGQQTIIRKLEWEGNLMMKQAFLSKTGARAAGELVAKRHEFELDDDHLSVVLTGAVREIGVESSFAAVRDLAASGEPSHAVHRAITRMLNEDPMATSKLIGDLPPGPDKYQMTLPMIEWLVARGDKESAEMWRNSLQKKRR